MEFLNNGIDAIGSNSASYRTDSMRGLTLKGRKKVIQHIYDTQRNLIYVMWKLKIANREF